MAGCAGDEELLGAPAGHGAEAQPRPRGVERGGEEEGCQHGYLIFSNHYLEFKEIMNI